MSRFPRFVPLRQTALGRVFAAALIVAAATVLHLASASAAQAPSLATPARPVIILVHGRGQLLGDSVALRTEWMRAMREGARKATGSDILGDDDVQLAWYADALDPLAPAACERPAASSAAGRAARRSDPALRDVFLAVGEGLISVLDAFDGYARGEMRAIAGDLLFLGDSARRCAAEGELEAALRRAADGRRPVILVAHSFGSLLAYGYLQHLSPDDSAAFDIRRLVTIGSLLGAPSARELLLGDSTTRVAIPRAVEGWTNIVNPDDALAYPIPFADDSVSARAVNLTTTPGLAGEDPHGPARYLRDPAGVGAVVGAWCKAFEPATGRPDACARVPLPR